MERFRRVWPYILLAMLAAINIGAWTQRQEIADWLRLRGYQPPAEITALATDTTMTPAATNLFYVNHPSLEDKESFNQHCSDKGEETAVLGCYHGNRQGIYLYAVTDPRLYGVRQVTAAHEMLHQAYDRLSVKERERIERLLQGFYEQGLKEASVRTKIESYRQQGGTVLVNEMHSIFGSEVRELPTELEAYYSQYFMDRLKVVSFSEAYQAEFTRRQALVEQYDTQLASLKNQININRATLEDRLAYLRAKDKDINQDVAERNQAKYEADVIDYNSTVASYNALLTATRSLIDQHNQIVNQRNELAVQERQLHQALDSRLETPGTKQ